MSTAPWPWPGDTALDRARRIARGYRDALASADPATCQRLDTAAAAVGETWLHDQPRLALDPDDWYPAAAVAADLGVRAGRVRNWGYMQWVPTITDRAGHRLYRISDCQDLMAQSRRDRASRGAGQSPGV